MADNTNKTIHTLVDSDGKPVVLAVAVQPRANSDTSTLADGAGSSLRCVRLNIVDAQSMTSIEEVDVYTTADAVYYNTATKETIIDYINFRLAYTNSVPLPEDIGAFHKGDIFNEMDLKDVLEGILYPNITPTVKLSCSLPSTPNFVGQDISPVEFTLTLSNVSNGAATLAYLVKDGSNVATFANLPNGDGSTTYKYSGEVEKEHKFKAVVTFPNGTFESEELEIPFVNPIYLSSASQNRPNVDNPIQALTDPSYKFDTFPNMDNVKIDLTYPYTAGYLTIAIPVDRDSNYRIDATNININGINCTSAFELVDNVENTLLPTYDDDTPRLYNFFISYNILQHPMSLSIQVQNSELYFKISAG